MQSQRHHAADPKKGENTSDHTYQSILVHLADSNDTKKLSLRGATWNLLNRCVSKATNGNKYSNNPWNNDETVSEYLDRKEKQLSKIETILFGKTSEPKDFFLLQEIDFLLFAPKGATEEEKIRYRGLCEQFKNRLQKNGYDIILSEPIPGVSSQPAAIIYNKNNLNLVKDSERPVLPNSDNAFRGYEAEFIHNKSKSSVTLVSLHLDYDHDYSEQIPAFQAMKIAMDKFTIMGGDTNHAPNQNIVGLINNWNNITNIGATLDGDKISLSANHANNNDIKKCYDGFFVNPTTDTKAIAVEEKAEVFDLDKNMDFVVRDLNPAKEYPRFYAHETDVGKAWARNAIIPSRENDYRSSIAPNATLFAAPRPENPIVLYKARRTGIAVRFPDKTTRDHFLKAVGMGQIHANSSKHEGGDICPKVYHDMPDTLYFPFVENKAENSLTLLFPNSDTCGKVMHLLGLERIGGNTSEVAPTEIKLADGIKRFKDRVTETKLSQTDALKNLTHEDKSNSLTK